MIPKTIYLQWYDELGEEPDDKLEVTWCADEINETDIKYIIASDVDALKKRIAELEDLIK